MSDKKLPELFGSQVFNEVAMKERLSDACYQASPMGLRWSCPPPMRSPEP